MGQERLHEAKYDRAVAPLTGVGRARLSLSVGAAEERMARGSTARSVENFIVEDGGPETEGKQSEQSLERRVSNCLVYIGRRSIDFVSSLIGRRSGCTTTIEVFGWARPMLGRSHMGRGLSWSGAMRVH